MKVYIGRYPSDRTLRRDPDAVQKKQIRIDRHDTWNMAETLAEIILPMLKQLKEFKHGSPGIMPTFRETSNDTYPQITFDFYKDGDDLAWEIGHKQWEEILDKMIWSFEQICIENRDDQFHHGVSNIQFVKVPGGTQLVNGPGHTATFDRKGHDEYYAKIQEGLDLFGKHYMNLWD